MYKIYSRRRFILKPHFSKKANRPTDKTSLVKRKILILCVIIIVILLIFKLIFDYIEPIFEAKCHEKAKSIATIITNQQSTIVMNNYQYEELYTIEKDSNGDIVIIKSNVAPINNMISDLTEKIQKEFDKIENSEVDIPLGVLTGIYFLSGFGPNIPIQVAVTGTVDTEVKSEFIAQGINQTLHRVYVEFDCNMQIVTPLKNYSKNIINQVIIAEHVIVGNIPEGYYNFEGMSNIEDSIDIIN